MSLQLSSALLPPFSSDVVTSVMYAAAVVESTTTEPVVELEPVVEEAHPPAPPANKFEIEADSLNQDKLKDLRRKLPEIGTF